MYEQTEEGGDDYEEYEEEEEELLYNREQLMEKYHVRSI